jgi:uncharacterized damage-inducible protein DinB
VNPKLQNLFDSLESERYNLLASIKKARSHKQAPEGKWSINQIVAHLIAAEKLSIVYLNKKILGIKETENTGLWEETKMVVLQISQRLPFKFKAPRVVVENTPIYSNLDELLTEWDNVRSELKALLEKFDETQLRKKIYKHVRAGKLNIQHALMFFREHIIHHKPQIKRLLS